WAVRLPFGIHVPVESRDCSGETLARTQVREPVALLPESSGLLHWGCQALADRRLLLGSRRAGCYPVRMSPLVTHVLASARVRAGACAPSRYFACLGLAPLCLTPLYQTHTSVLP